jgi:hypothetical protein
VVPFTEFDVVSLSVFSVFYGLDWVATGPATVALTNDVFGRRDAPVIVAWIFVDGRHRSGMALVHPELLFATLRANRSNRPI